MFDLSGKVAVVTGAGDGIGKGVARILSAAGARVVVSDIDADKARAVAESIGAFGGSAAATACNVLVDADLEALIEFAVSTFGTVNILVNNAGMGGGGRENPFEIDRSYVEKIYAINVFAPWALCRLAAPYMQKSGYGSIVNITSKAALTHMASNLAYDYGPMGIRVNSVGPGATRTHALASILSPELEARMLSGTPLKRLGEVGDIAMAVLFFAAPASSWVSGQVLMVNGGGTQTLG